MSSTESADRLLIPRPWYKGDRIRVRARFYKPTRIWTVYAIDKGGDALHITTTRHNGIYPNGTIMPDQAVLIQDEDMDICEWVV
jgi:hypothetical protein